MPLRAIFNDKDIFSYKHDKNSWDELKATYKQNTLLMPCCKSKSIPKISKLGNYFFAHARKGQCCSAPESAEHIFLKTLVAKTALSLGWDVETEKPGETPEGERWIADIFCSKGDAKLAFEIQWSPQSSLEFQRRQEKYTSSGVRAAWLYKLRSNKEYWIDDIPYTYSTPVFGIKYQKGSNDLYVPQYDQPIDDFIRGVLLGKLKWSPHEGEELIAKLIPHAQPCWRCKIVTTVLLGVSFYNKAGNEITFKAFSDDEVPGFIMRHTNNQSLSVCGVGAIKYRHSNTRNESYLSNGCYHCDAIMGNFFISESLVEYMGDLPAPIMEFLVTVGQETPYMRSEWYFDGKQSKHIF